MRKIQLTWKTQEAKNALAKTRTNVWVLYMGPVPAPSFGGRHGIYVHPEGESPYRSIYGRWLLYPEDPHFYYEIEEL